jgi:hypothetical protein
MKTIFSVENMTLARLGIRFLEQETDLNLQDP